MEVPAEEYSDWNQAPCNLLHLFYIVDQAVAVEGGRGRLTTINVQLELGIIK